MTEREILIACFLAVSALAERLTGEQMLIQIPLDGGGNLTINTGSSVQWISHGAGDPSLEDRSSRGTCFWISLATFLASKRSFKSN
jgi:hypothetical protein